MTEAIWLSEAKKYIGTHEISGPKHSPQVLKFLDEADGARDGKNLQGIHDDETPWCATFVSAVLENVKVRSTRSAWARSYLEWGQKLKSPAVGCVVVFERGPSSGHVAFVVGKDSSGHIMCLGGNQGDAVNIKPFPTSRVIGYRWPTAHDLPVAGVLPVVRSDGKLSKNEA